jgi:hypothetical protein
MNHSDQLAVGVICPFNDPTHYGHEECRSCRESTQLGEVHYRGGGTGRLFFMGRLQGNTMAMLFWLGKDPAGRRKGLNPTRFGAYLPPSSRD